mgnify:CR=1 FL=1
MKDKLLLIIFILFFTNLTSPLIQKENDTKNIEKTHIYIVKKDDSLWKIAKKYKINNIYEFVTAVKVLNNLESSYLFENQKIILP